MLAAVALSFLLFCVTVRAHCSVWHEALYGYNYPRQANDSNQNYDNDEPSNPLRRADNLTWPGWFAHGLWDYPPLPGAMMELPSGGVFTAEYSQSRHSSSMRDPAKTDTPLPDVAACNLHYSGPDVASPPPNNSLLGGAAFSVVYESDPTKVVPSDMIVITVNYTAPFYRLTDFHIPKMPPCGSDGCLCCHHWIHLGMHGEGYPYEIYNTCYRCTFTGDTDSSKTLVKGTGQIPVKCDVDTSLCVSGRKQPMYLYQVNGNNVVEPGDQVECPSHNQRYGFENGPQTLWSDETTTANTTSSDSSDSGSSSALSATSTLDPTSTANVPGSSDSASDAASSTLGADSSVSSTPVGGATGGSDGGSGSVSPSSTGGSAGDVVTSAIADLAEGSSSTATSASATDTAMDSDTGAATGTATSPVNSETIDPAQGGSSTATADSATDTATDTDTVTGAATGTAASSVKTCAANKRSRIRSPH